MCMYNAVLAGAIGTNIRKDRISGWHVATALLPVLLLASCTGNARVECSIRFTWAIGLLKVQHGKRLL